ncbi:MULTISPECIES: hypothetical protein [unclassified Aureimonas]|uniref:hypothetical protein n=1 Tax=unclassified Aureimonas TaxID=2615206 RepID=UPI00070204CD|nr:MULTISPECIES: hypothetical protein [unclassified Aureimonas]KQT64398.1 hypothetical protein ASG62_05370 [Aureimonas sp. Leaf427]KQT81588.1 hypothetical protein ASG54_02650 [Aureimonas sp. Leaf460]
MAIPETLPLVIDPEIGARLERRASLEQTSASSIAERAIAAYLQANELKEEAIHNAALEADKGVFISSEAIERWMMSWDTDDELPPPEPDILLHAR